MHIYFGNNILAESAAKGEDSEDGFEDYTPIEGITRGFGPNWENRIICMWNAPQFRCHWDDSGHDPGTKGRSSDKPILLVGGYMAHVDEWAQFTREWMPIIQPYIDKYGKLFPSFHMAPWINARYPYDHFPEADFDRLMDVINRCVRFHVTWAIEIDAYLNVIKAQHIGEQDIVRAYHICARKCIEVVSWWAKLAQHKYRIHHIFHHGNSAWPTFQDSFSDEFLDRLNILRPESQSEVHIVPLQASDIIAHQMGRDELTKRGMMPTPRKLYADKLTNVVPGMRQYIDKAELSQLYAEEMMLEQHRKAGRFPERLLVKSIDPEAPARLMELFKPPSEYWLRAKLLSKGRA